MRAIAVIARASSPPLALASAVWDGAITNEGSLYGVSIGVSGGVSPYTYRLKIGGSIVASASDAGTTKYIFVAASRTWNAQSVSVEVTDAASVTVSSASLGVLTVRWIDFGGGVSVSSYAPTVGQITSMTMTVSASPAPSSYAWEYRYKPAGGAWGSWISFGWSGALVYSGTYSGVGDQYQYRCTATNVAGSRQDTSSTVTVT